MRRTIVLTGAAGALGTKLYPLLKPDYDVVLTDIRTPEWLRPGDRFQAADLCDQDALRAVFRGAHGVIHMGAIGAEDAWEKILAVSIDGTYKVFEAARLEGVERVVYPSSVHAVGFYPRAQTLGVNEYVRPDSRYGLSKAFGEAAGSLYADKYGLKVLVIRIGNGTFEKPEDERLLSIWLSARDLTQLVRIGLEHPDLRYEIVYGCSGNTRTFWDNSTAERLGYRPQDNAEAWAAEVLRDGPKEDPRSLAAQRQGGAFVEFA